MKGTEPLQGSKICFRILCSGWKTEICSEEIPNPDFTVESMLYDMSTLQSNQENCEHLKYFRNVYCVKTNHSKDQGMQKVTKLQPNYLSHLRFSFLRLIGLFFATK